MLDVAGSNVRDTSVKAEDLGIKYRRYRKQAVSLKEAVVGLFKATEYEAFWGLREVSFSLYPGDRVGIVGPNGAGKSTLLKALAGVLPPSEGKLTVQGKVAPLIELGGGFNMELTGRENIYLNGAIMGRSRAETATRLEAISEFADIGDFLDTPMRSYSSGMRARLGFAAATDINPDILLLDEIFSVGDEAFRKKATARMENFFQEQKTVVLVSHSMPLIERYANRVLYLRGGQVVAFGPPQEVIQQYLADVEKLSKARK